MRGEKILGAAGDGYEMGSPPRARGKGGVYEIPAHRRGITPACAGKRVSVTALQPVRRDHPRVRGEKSLGYRSATGKEGSPPRARGKDQSGVQEAINPGITPACAGKSLSACRSRPSGRDHPRVRGEKDDAILLAGAPQGSPPRARGKAMFQQQIRGRAGITPACAGKRRSSARTR